MPKTLSIAASLAVLVASLFVVSPAPPESPTPTHIAVKRITVTPSPVPEPSQSAEVATSRPETPAPVSTPSPPPIVPQSANMSVVERIKAAWPGDIAKVLRVVDCESNFNPQAYNPAGPYYGLFQADLTFWRNYGGLQYAPRPDLAGVEAQVTVAWNGRQDRGWQPWPHCGKL